MASWGTCVQLSGGRGFGIGDGGDIMMTVTFIIKNESRKTLLSLASQISCFVLLVQIDGHIMTNGSMNKKFIA